jgi:hypothetical protein
LSTKRIGRPNLVVLDPDELTQAGPEAKLPENSMGRIAMDTVGDEQLIYVPGSHHFYRYRYDPAQGCLVKNNRWEPLYRVMSDQEQSFAWVSCLYGRACRFLDNGENEANTVVFASRPVGPARTPSRIGVPWPGNIGPKAHPRVSRR